MAGKIKQYCIATAVLLMAGVLMPSFSECPAAERMEAISYDTEWSGRIVLDHTVVVQKGATLTILPGTRIEFLQRDDDKDDIGDLALRVEGRIRAVGTAGEPIIFTSGSKEPKPADWMFVIIEFSRDSMMKYCRFSYAYSGLQVHYSTVEVTDCVFSSNIDGFRFSTANVLLENNLMENNVNGVRYEERKSRTRIRRNIIRNNRIGVFCVTGSDDTTVFEENNIYDNRSYNFKMGLLQQNDIHLAVNWWGTDNISDIRESIFDGEDDQDIGQVYFQPVSGFDFSPAGPNIE